MEKRTVKIVGTNNLFEDLRNKEFVLDILATNSSMTHVIVLKDYEDQIYFDPSSKIKFLEHGIWIEGFAQIKNRLGNLSVLIQTNETDAIV